MRIPRSRAAVTVIAMFVKVAVMTAKTMIEGVKKSAGRSPGRPVPLPPKITLKMTMNRSGKANVKKAAAGLRQNARCS